ncbi:MAG: PilZ domain-containing protein [Nitrospiraceae bacterium]|nr:MAG: PilZ domain-containing protein [Nitrospiraceae bacterium]
MAERRECQRYIKRHPVVINAGGMAFKGTTVWLSRKGFFVRSQKNFNEGVPVDITFHLTEDSSCTLKGTVRFAKSIELFRQKNGMGIELTEKNQNYLALIRSLEQENS